VTATHVPRHAQAPTRPVYTPPPPPKRRKRHGPRWLPGLLLVSPSLILIGIFVYGFLGWNVRVSFTNWRGLSPSYHSVGFDNYVNLFKDDRFRGDIRNLIVFTVVFVAGSMVLGFVMAMLLDKGVRGEGFFRGVYLFPMAISFIATAIIWRWLLDNGSGADTAGLNKLFSDVGLGFLRSDWHKSDSIFAIAAVALPAGWALSGYVMALFLAGMRSVPETLRESARLDGASELQVFWYVVRPMLRPITFSVVLIMLHISLKTFDLLYAIDQGNLRTGRLRDDEWGRLSEAIEKLGSVSMFIDESSALSPSEVRARARRQARQCGQLGLIVVDYLQLMSGSGGASEENRATVIGEISRGLKSLAKELKCPVIALSQLNRSVETRTDKRPMMSDLRESGAIEQDADVIMFIYRDDYYNKDSKEPGVAEIIISKQRNGPTGTVKLAFVKPLTKFESLASGGGDF